MTDQLDETGHLDAVGARVDLVRGGVQEVLILEGVAEANGGRGEAT